MRPTLSVVLEFAVVAAVCGALCTPMVVYAIWRSGSRLVIALLSVATVGIGLLGVLVPTNRYGWMDSPRLPYDCDNPELAGFLVTVTAVVGLSAITVLVVELRRKRSIPLLSLLAVLVLILLVTIPRLPAIAKEQMKNTSEDSPCI